jgi:ribosomal protein S18 acetylase RimI-like enzyme
MTVRRLVAADVPAYRALMLEAYERHPDAFTSTVAERAALPLSWWESRTGAEAPSAELVFGAFHEGRLAGAAGLAFEKREKSRHKATLFGMYVPERFRKLGLGRELVLAALEHARARDIRVVQLTVTEGNAAAEGLYGRCGFVRFGVEPLAMASGADYLSKVHMWCDVSAAPRGPAK